MAIPWFAIAQAAVGAGMSIFGAIKNAKEKKKREQLVDEQHARNMALVRSRIYNTMQDSAIRGQTDKAAELLAEQNNRARRTNVVAGGTTASEIAGKQASANALAQNMATIGNQKIADQKQGYRDMMAENNNYFANRNKIGLESQQSAATMSQLGASLVSGGLTGVVNKSSSSIPNGFKLQEGDKIQGNYVVTKNGSVYSFDEYNKLFNTKQTPA